MCLMRNSNITLINAHNKAIIFGFIEESVSPIQSFLLLEYPATLMGIVKAILDGSSSVIPSYNGFTRGVAPSQVTNKVHKKPH